MIFNYYNFCKEGISDFVRNQWKICRDILKKNGLSLHFVPRSSTLDCKLVSHRSAKFATRLFIHFSSRRFAIIVDLGDSAKLPWSREWRCQDLPRTMERRLCELIGNRSARGRSIVSCFAGFKRFLSLERNASGFYHSPRLWTAPGVLFFCHSWSFAKSNIVQSCSCCWHYP